MTTILQFGIDRLLADPVLRRPLAGKRIALKDNADLIERMIAAAAKNLAKERHWV